MASLTADISRWVQLLPSDSSVWMWPRQDRSEGYTKGHARGWNISLLDTLQYNTFLFLRFYIWGCGFSEEMDVWSDACNFYSGEVCWALLLFSSNTLRHIHHKPSKWICHRCSPVKTSVKVKSPKNVLNGASCQLGSLSVKSLYTYSTVLILSHTLFVCVCLSLRVDVCTHPNTYPY